MASIPAAAQGQSTAVKDHDRLIDQPDELAVTPDNVSSPIASAHCGECRPSA